jgi:hypothetical protein
VAAATQARSEATTLLMRWARRGSTRLGALR